VLNRILVAIDQFDDSGALVAAAGELSRGGHTAVRVVHCLEFIGPGCAAPVLSTAEAELLVECAVFQLRSDGIPSDGLVRRADNGSVHRLIAGTAAEWGADLVLLGSNQRRGLGRLRGHGVRERLIRLSPVPVLVAPVDRRRPAHRFAHH
jgi:nucleotide-binding universal stress UspA family protein